jgi:hypothetical protein
MERILDLAQRSDGRLAGSVGLPGDPALRPFWGVLELMACVEELRATAIRASAPAGGYNPLVFGGPVQAGPVLPGRRPQRLTSTSHHRLSSFQPGFEPGLHLRPDRSRPARGR